MSVQPSWLPVRGGDLAVGQACQNGGQTFMNMFPQNLNHNSVQNVVGSVGAWKSLHIIIYVQKVVTERRFGPGTSSVCMFDFNQNKTIVHKI